MHSRTGHKVAEHRHSSQHWQQADCSHTQPSHHSVEHLARQCVISPVPVQVAACLAVVYHHQRAQRWRQLYLALIQHSLAHAWPAQNCSMFMTLHATEKYMCFTQFCKSIPAARYAFCRPNVARQRVIANVGARSPECGEQLGYVRRRVVLDLSPGVARAPAQLDLLSQLCLPAQEGEPGSKCAYCQLTQLTGCKLARIDIHPA